MEDRCLELGQSSARISVPYCHIFETLELERALTDWSTTGSSLPSIIRLGNCELLELVANSSGVTPLHARISAGVPGLTGRLFGRLVEDTV